MGPKASQDVKVYQPPAPKAAPPNQSTYQPPISADEQWEVVDTSRLQELGGGQFGKVYALDEDTVIKVIIGKKDL